MTAPEPAPRDVVLDGVVQTIADVLSLAPETLGPESGATTVTGWDSLGHVRIILALEARFGVAFTMAEIEHATDIEALARIVSDALARNVAGG